MVLSPFVTSSDITKTCLRRDNNVIIQTMDGSLANKSNTSTKLVKLVVPQSTNSSSSIKMLSNCDGLSSALRIPTKIQLTKTLSISSTFNENNSFLISKPNLLLNQKQFNDQHEAVTSPIIDIKESQQQSTVDYPPTPPPPIVDHRNSNSHTPNKINERDRSNEATTMNSKGILNSIRDFH